MPNVVFGDISPRTAAYAAADLLERAQPHLGMARFGQQQSIPKNKSQTIKFRRYNALAVSTVPMVEGVTPGSDSLTFTDVQSVLQQFGRRVTITDVVMDTHEDPVLKEATDILGELAGQTAETIVFNALRAGTNVIYSGGTSRATVNSGITKQALDRAIRLLKRQNAKRQTMMLGASDKVGTGPIRPAFIAFCHPDVQTDLEALAGWKDKSEYASGQPVAENEIGAYKEIRFLTSTIYDSFKAAGASSATLLNNGSLPGSAAPCDVYPLIIAGKDSYGTVSLAGATAITPMVVNPKPSDSDPLAQRGHVAWKTWLSSLILNDAWMVRIETGAVG